jgi:hypothetical protein
VAAIQWSAERIDHAAQPGLARANAVLIGREDHAPADANAVEAVERQQMCAGLVDRHDFREQWLASVAFALASVVLLLLDPAGFAQADQIIQALADGERALAPLYLAAHPVRLHTHKGLTKRDYPGVRRARDGSAGR